MNPEPFSPEVVLDVWFEGRLVQSVPLDTAVFATDTAPAASGAEPVVYSERRRDVVVELPPSGPLRVGVHLRRPGPGIAGNEGRTTYSFSYDGSGRIAPFVGQRMTFTYSIPPAPTPPDDPHVVG